MHFRAGKRVSSQTSTSLQSNQHPHKEAAKDDSTIRFAAPVRDSAVARGCELVRSLLSHLFLVLAAVCGTTCVLFFVEAVAVAAVTHCAKLYKRAHAISRAVQPVCLAAKTRARALVVKVWRAFGGKMDGSLHASRRLPSQADGYELVERMGSGAGHYGTVFRAMCLATNEEVAIRIVDLDELEATLDDISRDIKVMSMSSHPNVLPFSTCFVSGNDLWVVMPLLTGGSVSSLLACAYPDGMPPETAIYIIHSTLKAVEYFHSNGQIHRDIRAANVMLDSHGQPMLSDYGMMGWMVEGGWERKQRQTFVGTPCWMAPEVLEQSRGYDYKADIWSLGVTALEVAMGAAPYVNYPPMKVLILTLQSPPPTLTGRAAQIYPEVYKQFVAACLTKDPEKRPSAKELLNHPVFSSVRKPDDFESVLSSLPPVGSRGGAAQKQLYRELQKVSAPASSGIWSLSTKGMGWDFGDENGALDSSQRSEMAPATPSGNFDAAASSEDAMAANLLNPRVKDTIAAAAQLSTKSFLSADEGVARGASRAKNGAAADRAARTSSTAQAAQSADAVPASSRETSSIAPSTTPGSALDVPKAVPPSVETDHKVGMSSEGSSGDNVVTIELPANLLSVGNRGSVAQGTGISPPMSAHPPAQIGGGKSVTANRGVTQKKGRFTVSDVEVPGEKPAPSKPPASEEDAEITSGGVQQPQNGAGGGVSASSSFTSVPGQSTETSPSSVPQGKARTSGGQSSHPVGVDSNDSSHGGSLGRSFAANAAKERRKSRFEVKPVNPDGKSTGSSGAAQPVKSKGRFQVTDISDLHEGLVQNNRTRSPKGGVAAMAESDGKSHGSRGTEAGASHRNHLVEPPTGASQAKSAMCLTVQNLTNCVTALVQENEMLKREIAQLRDKHNSETVGYQQQLAQQQRQVAIQQMHHEKMFQELHRQIVCLQKRQDMIVPHDEGDARAYWNRLGYGVAISHDKAAIVAEDTAEDTAANTAQMHSVHSLSMRAHSETLVQRQERPGTTPVMPPAQAVVSQPADQLRSFSGPLAQTRSLPATEIGDHDRVPCQTEGFEQGLSNEQSSRTALPPLASMAQSHSGGDSQAGNPNQQPFSASLAYPRGPSSHEFLGLDSFMHSPPGSPDADTAVLPEKGTQSNGGSNSNSNSPPQEGQNPSDPGGAASDRTLSLSPQQSRAAVASDVHHIGRSNDSFEQSVNASRSSGLTNSALPAS